MSGPTVQCKFVDLARPGDSDELKALWREHALLVRLSRTHGQRASFLSSQIQPTLLRIWELQHGATGDRCSGRVPKDLAVQGETDKP